MSIWTDWKRKIAPFFKKNERIFIFTLSLVLSCALSFELGVLYKAQTKDQVLIVEKPTTSLAQIKQEMGISSEIALAKPSVEARDTKQQSVNQKQENAIRTDCTFVGSKNSTKYHSPSCSYAKQIKPENVVCFKSKEEAEGRGYIAGCIQ